MFLSKIILLWFVIKWISYCLFSFFISSIIILIKSLFSKFLWARLVFNVPKICSTLLSCGLYGGIVNATNYNSFNNSFTLFVLCIAALSNIKIVLFFSWFLSIIQSSSPFKSSIKLQKSSSVVDSFFKLKYTFFSYNAAMQLYLEDVSRISWSASSPILLHV